jgi:uncharacterized phiE125 gp8 family phage protein
MANQTDIKTGFQLDTAATTLPVTVDEIKEHLRIDDASENTWLKSQIEAATNQVEIYLRRQLISATWKLHLDEFPDVIELRKCPLQSISSIQYYDGDNAQQTLSTAAYSVDLNSQPARISRAFGYAWPLTYQRPAAVTVTFVAGYGSRSAVPEQIKLAIKNLVGYRYWNREGGDPTLEDGILAGTRLYQWS